MPDPTLADMLATLETVSAFKGRDLADDRLIACHHFATENYNGLGSNLYAAICEIDWDGDEEPSLLQRAMMDALETQFGDK